MKNWRLIIVTLAALGLSLWAFGQGYTYRNGPFMAAANPVVAGGLTCPSTSTAAGIIQSTEGDFQQLSYQANQYYFGQMWTNVVSDTNLCRVQVWGRHIVGDVSGKTFYCEVWGTTGSPPTPTGSPIGTATLAGASFDVTGNQGTNYFTFSTPVAMTAGNSYFISFSMHGIDTSNYGNIYCTTSDAIGIGYIAFGPSDWATFDRSQTIDFTFKLWFAQ
jgi:hypothetical protein